jgi:uncharacterized membrane protein (DUF485 family)
MTMLRLGFSAYNDMIQAPLMGAGVEMSQELLNTASNTLMTAWAACGKSPIAKSSSISYALIFPPPPPITTTIQRPTPPRRNFICLPRQMHGYFGVGHGLWGISNIRWRLAIWPKFRVRRLSEPLTAFSQALCWLPCILSPSSFFGMFLLDMLFRFILTGALSPIWLASAVFPNTRFAFSQGVRQLARCALTMVLMTVLIVIAAGLIGISTQNALQHGKTTLEA